MILPVRMNIPDKPAVCADVRRVLKPGGILSLYEQMQIGGRNFHATRAGILVRIVMIARAI